MRHARPDLRAHPAGDRADGAAIAPGALRRAADMLGIREAVLARALRGAAPVRSESDGRRVACTGLDTARCDAARLAAALDGWAAELLSTGREGPWRAGRGRRTRPPSGI